MEELTTLEDCEFLTGNLFKNSFVSYLEKLNMGEQSYSFYGDDTPMKLW